MIHPAAEQLFITNQLHEDLQPEGFTVPLNAGALAAEDYFRPRQFRADTEPRSRDELVDRAAGLWEDLNRKLSAYEYGSSRCATSYPKEYSPDDYARNDNMAAFDIVRTITEGKRLTLWLDADDLLNVTAVPKPGQQPLSIPVGGIPLKHGASQYLDVAKLLRDIYHFPDILHLRFTLNDLHSDGSIREDAAAKEKVLRQLLVAHGLTEMKLQLDVATLRASAYLPQAKTIMEVLDRSGNGVVVRGEGSGTKFITAPWLRRWAGLRGGRRGFEELMLASEAGYNPTLLRAAAFLDKQNDSSMHVLLSGRSGVPGKNIETILRAGEFVRPDGSEAFSGHSMHTLLLGAEETSAPLSYAAHRIAWLFRDQARQYGESLRASPFDRLQVEGDEGYLTNYVEKIPQDKLVVRAQLRAEARLAVKQNIDPHDPETLFKPGEVMHICVGTNPYTAMLSSIYSRPEPGSVIGWDIAPNVIAYNNSIRQDKSYDLERRRMWHEEIMSAAQELSQEPDFQALDLTPEIFANAETVTRQQLHVMRGDIEDLPANTFYRVYMHFGAEATVRSMAEYTERMRKIAYSLRGPQARLIMVLTEKSDALWPGGKRKYFQAFSSSMDSFELALLDCELEIDGSPDQVDRGLPEDQKLRPGENFVLVVAKLRRSLINHH